MRKLRHRDVKRLAQGHRATQWQSQDLNPPSFLLPPASYPSSSNMGSISSISFKSVYSLHLHYSCPGHHHSPAVFKFTSPVPQYSQGDLSIIQIWPCHSSSYNIIALMGEIQIPLHSKQIMSWVFSRNLGVKLLYSSTRLSSLLRDWNGLVHISGPHDANAEIILTAHTLSTLMGLFFHFDS